MKKYTLTVIVLCLLLLCSCKTEYKDPPAPKPDHGTQQTVPDTPDVQDSHVQSPDANGTPDDTASQTPPVPDTPPAEDIPNTPAVPTEPENSSYVLSIPAYVPIYNGPSYDFDQVKAVGENGLYTITEEKLDGNDLWGKLKSGIGWVHLDYIAEVNKNPPILTSNFAEPKLVGENGYHEYLSGAPEHAFRIVFNAHQNLTDVALTSMFYGDNGYETDKVLYSLDSLTPIKPLVAELIFAGNGTIFGIECRDSSGKMRYFALTVNGRNGTYDMNEYTK